MLMSRRIICGWLFVVLLALFTPSIATDESEAYLFFFSDKEYLNLTEAINYKYDVTSTFEFSVHIDEPQNDEIEDLLRRTHIFYNRVLSTAYPRSFVTADLAVKEFFEWNEDTVILHYIVTAYWFAIGNLPTSDKVVPNLVNIDEDYYLESVVRLVEPAVNFPFAKSVSNQVVDLTQTPAPTPMPPSPMPTPVPTVFDPENDEVCHYSALNNVSSHLDHASNIHVSNLDDLKNNATHVSAIQPLIDQVKRVHYQRFGDPANLLPGDEELTRNVIASIMSRSASSTGAPDNAEDFNVLEFLRSKENTESMEVVPVVPQERRHLQGLDDDIACLESIVDVGADFLTIGSCLILGIQAGAAEKLIKNAMKDIIKDLKEARREVVQLWVTDDGDSDAEKIFKSFKILADAIGVTELWSAIDGQLSFWQTLEFIGEFIVHCIAILATAGVAFAVEIAVKIKDVAELAGDIQEMKDNCGGLLGPTASPTSMPTEAPCSGFWDCIGL